MAAFDLQKQRQPFRCDFRIGQDVFDPGQFWFWQKQRIWLPVQQAFVKDLLRMNAGAEDPNCGIGSVPFINSTGVMGMCDYRSQKRLRRLDHMGKSNGPFSLLYRLESACDWLAGCDALQKFR
jgi:hypothetical protein